MTNDRRARERVSLRARGVVYLLHFHERLGTARHSIRHYVGFTTDLDGRLTAHREGRGARVTEVLRERGIGWDLAASWPGNREIENALKLHGTTRICPECTPSPRVPRIVQQAIEADEKRQAREARQAERRARLAQERAAGIAAAKADPYQAGRQMARQWLESQYVPGRTADQIEAAHEYVTGPWREMPHHTPAQIEGHRGYTDQVQAALTALREYEAETPEAERGDPTGVGASEPEAEVDDETDTSWLARDGDGQVLEVDASTGYPGREASPDDGRPAAEADADPRERAFQQWSAAQDAGERVGNPPVSPTLSMLIEQAAGEFPEGPTGPEQEQADWDARAREEYDMAVYPPFVGPGYTEPPADWPGWHQDHTEEERKHYWDPQHGVPVAEAGPELEAG